MLLFKNTTRSASQRSITKPQSHKSSGRKPKGPETTVTCAAAWKTLTDQQDRRRRRWGRRLSVRKSIRGEERDMRGVTLMSFKQISITNRISLSSKRPRHSLKITHTERFLCKMQSQWTTSREHIYWEDGDMDQLVVLRRKWIVTLRRLWFS